MMMMIQQKHCHCLNIKHITVKLHFDQDIRFKDIAKAVKITDLILNVVVCITHQKFLSQQKMLKSTIKNIPVHRVGSYTFRMRVGQGALLFVAFLDLSIQSTFKKCNTVILKLHEISHIVDRKKNVVYVSSD